MKKIIQALVYIALIGIFGYTLYYLYQKNQEKPFIYLTDKAITTDIVKKTVATGSVIPRKEVLIKSQVSGIIDKLYFEPGEKIEKGALLAKIRIIPDMVNLNNAENRVNRSKIAYDNAKIEFDRMKKLLDEKVISNAEFLPVSTALKNAQEELNAAENNLALIKEGASKNSGTETNTLVRSTTSGLILDIPVKEGNQVIESNTFNEGTTIATIADINDMIFEGKVDESEVGKIREGMEIELTIGAIDQAKIKAKLEYISPKGVEENGAIQFQIRAAVAKNDSLTIRAGYSATADIVLDKRTQVLAISEAFLQFEEGKTFIEIETGNQQFEKRFITTGLSDGINIEVLEGLSAEDKIKTGKTQVVD